MEQVDLRVAQNQKMNKCAIAVLRERPPEKKQGARRGSENWRKIRVNCWINLKKQKKTRSRGAGKSILWEGGGDRENYTGGPALLEISISNIQYHCGE